MPDFLHSGRIESLPPGPSASLMALLLTMDIRDVARCCYVLASYEAHTHALSHSCAHLNPHPSLAQASAINRRLSYWDTLCVRETEPTYIERQYYLATA